MNKKLRVSHFPQIPCKPYIVEVKSIEEAKFVSDVLAKYDLFQRENRIKPDYANATVVEQWDEDEQEWVSWFDEETGIDNIDEYFELLDRKVLTTFVCVAMVSGFPEIVYSGDDKDVAYSQKPEHFYECDVIYVQTWSAGEKVKTDKIYKK